MNKRTNPLNKTLSVILSILMVISTVAVAFPSFVINAEAASKYSVAQVKEAVSAAANAAASTASASDTFTFTGDDGKVLNAADVIYDYAVNGVKGGTVSSSDYNASNTLYNKVLADLGYSESSNEAKLIKNILYPEGKVVYDNGNRQEQTGSYKDSSSSFTSSKATYNTNVYDSVTKTASVQLNLDSYLKTFTSVNDIPSSFPTKVTYTFTNSNDTSAVETSQTSSGWLWKTYTHYWTSQKWNYISSFSRTVDASNTTAASELQSYNNFFTEARLATTLDTLLSYTAADLDALYESIAGTDGYLTKMQSKYTSAVLNNFFDMDAIADYKDLVYYASSLVNIKPVLLEMDGYMEAGYNTADYAGMSGIYTKATAAYAEILSADSSAVAELISIVPELSNFTVAKALAFNQQLFLDMEIYKLSELKATIDKTIADNEAKLADPENKTDITDLELNALVDKFNGFEKSWNTFSTAANNAVFSTGKGYITDFRTAILIKINTRGAQVDYVPFYEYFIPYIFAVVANWTDDEIVARHTADSAKNTQLLSTYNSYKGKIGEDIVKSVFTFSYNGADYLLTDAVAAYLEALKVEGTKRNEAQLDTLEAVAGTEVNINFENFVKIKKTIDSLNRTLDNYAASKGWLDAHYTLLHNNINALLTAYDAFIKSGGLDKFEQLHYHNENGEFVTRYAGSKEDADGVQVGFPNDIARGGDEDNYVVTEEKLVQSISNLDTLLTSDDFAKLLGLTDEEGNSATLAQFIDTMVSDMLFTSDLVNMFVGMVFPNLAGILEEKVDGAVAELGGTKADPNASGAYDVDKAVGDFVVSGTADIYADEAAFNGTVYQKSYPEILSEFGFNLYPSTLAESLKAFDAEKYGEDSDIYKALTAAGRDWNTFLVVAEDGTETVELGLDWGVTDYDTLIDVITAIFSSVEPVLQAVLLGAEYQSSCEEGIYGYSPKINLKYVGDSWLLKWIDLNTTLGAYGTLHLTVNPLEIYKTVWVPLVEALGITDGVTTLDENGNEVVNKAYTFKTLGKTASSREMAIALFEPIMQLIEQLKTAPVNKVLEILPNVVYALSMDKLQSLINQISINLNLTADLVVDSNNSGTLGDIVGYIGTDWLKGLVNENFAVNLKDEIKVNDILGFEVTDLNQLLNFVFETLGMEIALPTVYPGDIILYSDYSITHSDARGADRLHFTADKADLFYGVYTYLVNILGDEELLTQLLEILESLTNDEETEEAEDTTEGEEAAEEEDGMLEMIKPLAAKLSADPDNALAMLVELLVPQRYGMVEYDWYESAYNYGEIEGLNDADIVYLNYSNNWTKEKADYIAQNIDTLIATALSLTGEDQASLTEMLQAKIGELFTNKNITAIVELLASLPSILGDEVLVDFIGRGIGVDLAHWLNNYGCLFPSAEPVIVADNPVLYATFDEEGNITWYYNGIAFTDGDKEAFINILIELVKPLASIFATLTKGEDITLFDNSISILGYETYASSIAVLLEVLGVENILAPEDFNAMEETELLTFIINQVFDYIYSLVEGDTVGKILELLPNLVYFLQSNGLSVVLRNLLHPILVAVDTIRPLVDIDLNAVVSVLISDFISYGTVDFSKISALLSGEYEGEADETYTYCSIDVNNLNLDELVKIVDAFLGTALYDSQLISHGLNGLCAGAVEVENSVLNGRKTSSVDKGDTLTILISSVIETMQFVITTGENAGKTNGDVLFALLGEDATKLYNTVLTLFETEITEMLDFNWAYMYGEHFDYSNLENFTLPEHNWVYLEYANNWTKESAEYLDSVLAQLLDELLAATNGSTVSDLVTSAINGTLYNDAILNMLIEKVASVLVTLDETLLATVDCLLDTDIESWFEDCEFTYNEDGTLSSVKCHREWNINGDKNVFIASFVEALRPATRLIEWLCFSGEYNFFTGTETDEEGNYIYNDLITIEGGEGYDYAIVPLLEALSCTMNYDSTDSGIKPAEAYIDADGNCDVELALTEVITAVVDLLDKIGNNPVDVLLEILPNILYAINADALVVVVNNLLAPINALLDKLAPIVGEVDLDEMLGFPISHITWAEIFPLLEKEIGIYIPEKCQEFLATFFLGKVEYFTSANGRAAFFMTYSEEDERKDMVTILLSFAFDLLTYEANEEFFTELFGKDVYDSLKGVLEITEEKAMQEFDWYYTEFANTDKVFTAVETSGKYTGTYNDLWTKQMAQYIADNFPEFVDTMIELLGIEVEGKKVESLEDILSDYIGGTLYTQANAEAIINILKDFVAKLTATEPYGKYITNILRTSIGVDLAVWDTMTVTVTEGDRASFTDALVTILLPALPLLNLLLNDEDVTLFYTIEGEDSILIPGSEGYGYGIIPLLEALQCENVLTPAEYKEAIAADEANAVTAITDPLFDRIDAILANPAEEIFEMLPAVIYFINSNGLDTVVKNLLNSVDTVLAELEVLIGASDLCTLLGLDLSVYNFEYLLTFAVSELSKMLNQDLTVLVFDSVSELTVGKVVSYESKNGETYYTMVYGNNKYKADMVTIVLRFLIEFATSDVNMPKIKDGIRQYIASDDVYASVCNLLDVLDRALESEDGMSAALHIIYYIFYGLNTTAGGTLGGLKDASAMWRALLVKFENMDSPIVQMLVLSFKDILNNNFGDIITEDGIAPNGLIALFTQLIAIFQRIIAFLQAVFA